VSSNPCIYIDYRDKDHLNSRLGLREAVWAKVVLSVRV